MGFPVIWRRLAVGFALATTLCAAGLLALRTAPIVAAAPPPPFEFTTTDVTVVSGELILAVPSHFDRAALDALVQRSGGRVEHWVPRLGLARLLVPVGGEQQAARALEVEAAVRFVTENRLLAHVADIPLDEYWGNQWDMVQVQAPTAWDITWSDPTMVIAVIDTGVRLLHWDLKDQLWINPGESALDPDTGKLTCATPLASNMVDDDDNGYVDDCLGYDFVLGDANPTDEHGHGTFVAGIAGAATNNPDPYLGTPEGVAGMGRQARLMALRAMNASGRGTAFDIARAIDYATAAGAQVINLSLTFAPTTPPDDPDIEIMRIAVEAAQAADVLLVAASGNENYNGIDFPARFPGVLAVGASKRDDSRAGFSNYGARLDLVAPGVEIFSTLRNGNNSYGYYGGSASNSSGTSFASPHVAGVAALVRGLRPDLSQSAIYELVRHSADDAGEPGFDNDTGWGRLNAARAVSEAVMGLDLGLVSEPATVAVGGQTALRLAITAPEGVAAGLGARVAFSATGGVISPTVVMADSAGQALTWFVADAITGTVHISATLAGITATLPITITSGQPAGLTLTAAPGVIASGGGQAIVTAAVQDEGGSAVTNGAPVTFTTTLGSVAPVTTTTVGGQAITVLTSGVLSGTAVVQAEVGGYTATVPISILGAGEPYTLTLVAEPSEIRLDDAPAIITATVTDALGVLVPDGVAVTFSNDLGDLSWTQALTAGGRAVTQLNPGTMAGTAHITAQAGAAIGRVDVSILPGLAAMMTLAADPVELGAGLNQITRLDATARDRYGNPVSDGTVLSFTTTLGELVSSSASTAGGAAGVELLGGQVAGTATITVTAPGGGWANTQVRIRPARPAALALETIPDQIVVGGEVAIIRATVTDPFGNLVADGSIVTFTTKLGALRAISDTQAITGTLFSTGTINGVAEAALVSGQVAGTDEVRAVIGADVTQARSLRILAGPAAQLTLEAYPDQVRKGGRVELSAWVVDRYSNNVADGTVVIFIADDGQLDRFAVPTLSGAALTWLTAPDRVGSFRVTAFSSPVSAYTSVTVVDATSIFLPMIVR